MVEGKVAAGRSKIVENTVFLTVSGAGGLLFTLIQLGVLSRSLGGDLFGLFVALRGFTLLLATVILVGLPQVLIRYVPSYQARGRREKAVGLFLVSCIVVTALGVLLYLSRGRLIRFMPGTVRDLVPTDRTIIWMTLAGAALALRLLLYGGFNGLRAMGMQMIFDLFYLVALTGIIVALRERLTVILLFRILFVLNAAVFLIGTPFLLLLFRRLIGRPAESREHSVVLPSVAPYWLGSVLLSFVALAFSDVDRFVMASVLPLSAIGVFHVASRVNNVLKRFLGLPVLASQPEITRIYEEGRRHELAGKIRIFTKVTVVGSLLVVTLAAMISGTGIALLSGDDFAAAHRILIFLLPTIPIAAVIAPLLAAMKSLHFMRWAVVCDLVWMVFYFGTFFVAARRFGATGMAVAQLAAGLAQMTVAIALGRRERFFDGVGSRVWRVAAVTVPLAGVGMFALKDLGALGALVVAVLSPLAGRYILRLLAVFTENEKSQIVALVPVHAPRRFVAWFLASKGF